MWRDRAASTALALLALLLLGSVPAWADPEMPIRVGRVSEFAGELYLAPQDRPNEWASVALNYPITPGDNLWIGPSGRAEIDFGAGQFRLGGETNLQVTGLDEHQFSLFVASGRVIVRLRVLDAGDSVRIDTPQTQVEISRAGLYRIDVEPAQTTVAVREGEANVRFARGVQQSLPGQLVSVSGDDGANIAIQNGFGTDSFDAWSATRDRRYDTSRSATYVSREMVGSADLDAYGSWESYPEYGAVWFPTTVAAGWAPYRFGQWAWIVPWGWTWVDDAPWGYAPFHYGRWAWFSGRWGWCPGSFIARPVWAPALVAWYGGPGWSFSTDVGAPVYAWVPLGWGDPFWPHWRCSRHCWQRFNHPYAVNIAERPGSPPRHSSNSNVPGAMSAVPATVLAGAKPVAPNLVRPTGSAARDVPVLATAPSVTPLHVPHEPRSGPLPPANRFYPTAKPEAGSKPDSANAVPAGSASPTGSVAYPAAGAKAARVAAPAAPTPSQGGRTVAAPPERAIEPLAPVRRPTSPSAPLYGGVSDGRGAFTGVAPTPGPKMPAPHDRGIVMPPTMAAPAVVHAVPPPQHSAPIVPSGAPAVGVAAAPAPHESAHQAPASKGTPTGNALAPSQPGVPK